MDYSLWIMAATKQPYLWIMAATKQPYLWHYGCNSVAIKDYSVKSKIKASFMDSFLLFLQL